MGEIWSDFRDLIHKPVESPSVKGLGAFLLATGHLLFGQLTAAHGAIVILIAVDWISGAAWATVHREWESSRSLRGVVKVLLYGTTLLVGAQVDKVPIVGVFISASIVSLIVITEATSVLEQVDRWARWYKVDIPWIRSLVRYLRQRQDKPEWKGR